MEMPRIFQSRSKRNSKVARIRNDLASQRGERIDAIYCAIYQRLSKVAAENPELKGELTAFDIKMREWRKLQWKIKKNLACFPRYKTASPSAWCSIIKHRNQAEARLAPLYRSNSHLVHHLHVLFISVAPLEVLENAFQSTLYDLESVAVSHSYDKLAKGPLGTYVRTTLESRHPVVGSPTEKADLATYTIYLRYHLIQVINETRRQTLAQTQVETLKDETTLELITACGRLLITIVLGFFLLTWYSPGVWEEKIITAGFLVSIGGVLGSFLSAANRIGKMTENQESGRTLSVLSSSLRSIYFVPAIGVVGAWVVFIAIYGGLVTGLGPESGDIENSSRFTYLTGALMLGITAGFSERLVADILDRFNKKSAS